MSRIKMINNINLHRINMNSLTKSSVNNKNKAETKGDFKDLLESIQNQEQGIKFSKHATERMNSRNIVLDSTQIQKIENAIGKAEKKGVKEALILMDNSAF